ncbi:glycosyltransferase [Cellulomonas bogoriensis]|uniref:D-inositol 3-phosphate glycosyltransferase n=1 Tax=Cellulomonas bogoriensis 69B4 = DSM 16987 TaxID=1386082 RepID=A0A0A0C052_9CELL|nr:glycosyltransferase [Cellulomonas bogoriensis]KGM14048.1 glycosyl transferase family 1 [Cellulomonas bogoriensis 69B4 = DSM 16987]
MTSAPHRSELTADMPPKPRDWSVVHDFCFDFGGAERVSALLSQEVAGDGPLISLGGDPTMFSDAGVEEVVIRHPRAFRPGTYRQASLAAPLLSRATAPIEGNLLASSYAFSHHMRATGKKVVYCHTPLRQVWSGAEMYTSSVPGPVRGLANGAMRLLRSLDRRAAHEASVYVANSHAVAERVRRYYGIQPAAVAHPPYDEAFHPRALAREDVYVWVGRIVEPYKRLEPLLEAFRRTPGRRLLVIGDGRDGPRLRMGAPPNVTFLGPRTTREIAEAYCTARAVLFPSEDDFGLVPVEAMACGTPVIALGRGGAVETVVDGDTGILFPESEPAHIVEAIDRFERTSWDDRRITTHAAHNFGREAFVRTMRDVLNAA